MPKKPYKSKPVILAPSSGIVVVIDCGIASTLGLPKLCTDDLSVEGRKAYMAQQAVALRIAPAWLRTLHSWILEFRPTLISLSPDVVMDTVLYQDFLTAQSYGFGVPDHVPALYKPNGSINWFQFHSGRIPKSLRGFDSMEKNGLVFSNVAAGAFRKIPDKFPVVGFDRHVSSILKIVRAEARGRLGSANSILLLGLEPSDFRASDITLLKNLPASPRVTLVTPSFSVGVALGKALGRKGATQVELGSIESWISNRLLQWSVV